MARDVPQLTKPAGGHRLTRRTVRLRLTVLYGGLFLLSGAALLAITYVLVQHATAGGWIYHGPNGITFGSSSSQPHGTGTPGGLQVSGGSGLGALTQPQLQAQAHQWQVLATSQHANELHQLLIRSGIALAIMAILSILLGWIVAGRVLRPLRTITEAAHTISATNLHQRLALSGPDDELKRLADTFDELLGRLAGAFDSQRRFVANASHELRTPLTLARALLQMTLTDPEASVESFRSTCEEVMAAGDEQERLIEALLVLARSERGLDQRECLDLSVVTDEVLLTSHPEIEQLGLQVSTTISPAPIDGDRRLAERLVANLFSNAVRHNVVGGRVDVSTGRRDGRPFVAVVNTGPVIPTEEVGRLLEPFQRITADATQTGDGLGLGLSIVEAIATAHDATLSVRAMPDGGLAVEVRFPPASPHLTDRTAARAPADAYAG